MKSFPLSDLKKSRLSQAWFVFWQVFKLLWQVDSKALVLTIAINLIAGFLIYPSLRLEKAFIDGLIQNVGNDFWGQAGTWLVVLLSLRFAINVLTSILNSVGEYLRRKMSRIFSVHLNMLVAKKNADLDVAMLDSPEYRDKLSKIERESWRRAWDMIWPIGNIPAVMVGLISTLVIIFSFQPMISLVVFILSIPVLLIDSKYIKKEYRFSEKVSPLFRIRGWLFHYLLRPRNILEVKLLKLSLPFSKKVNKIQNNIFTQRFKIDREKTFWRIMASLPQTAFIFLTGVYLTSLVFAKKLTVGSVEMILRAIASFRRDLEGLVTNFLRLYENYLYVTDLVWLLSLKPTLEITKKGKKLDPKASPQIEFKNVWFRYTQKTPWILKDICLKVSPTQNLAIVGENGAGKSTLVKLICRFYDPQKGKILLNGIDLREYSIESLWENLSVLFQDFEVYPFSAQESIGYGDVNKLGNLDLIKKAAKKSEAHDFIQSLPLKYKNPLDPVFEKGIRPSIGQWQRIGLARVFLKDARIVVLDEPTSNVDPRAEEEIFKKVIKHTRNEILILISHRFSTVRRADKIYVLDAGKIIEWGTHENLMEKDGKYAHLFNLQAAGYR
ncbi:ABC transporter ATP-binding protein [Patescibacteria group bacterium]